MIEMQMQVEDLLGVEVVQRREAQSVDGQMDFLIFVEDHEFLFLDVVISGLEKSSQRDETDDLRAGDGHLQVVGVATGLS